MWDRVFHAEDQEFQHSPDFTAGCNVLCNGFEDVWTMFQPSPDFTAGCNLIDAVPTELLRCFNPHPTSQPGATKLIGSLQTQYLVSTLTRLHRRVQQACFEAEQPDWTVSTLTRLHSRVQLASRLKWGYWDTCFNPHPTSQPGATSKVALW